MLFRAVTISRYLSTPSIFSFIISTNWLFFFFFELSIPCIATIHSNSAPAKASDSERYYDVAFRFPPVSLDRRLSP